MAPAPTDRPRTHLTAPPEASVAPSRAPVAGQAAEPQVDPVELPETPAHIPSWQRQWGESFRDAASLLAFLGLDASQAPAGTAGIDFDPAFPLRVPRAYAALMRRGDWNDPLLRQVLALRDERLEAQGFTADAVGDHAAQDGRGVLRKYKGRALLVVTGTCAVHCRYCFRREFPYADQTMNHAEWDAVYARLNADPDVEEILFSGGDPLSLSDAKLERHLQGAMGGAALRRVRIHTRVPVVLPARVDDGLLTLVRAAAARKPLYIVLHVNHAQEVGEGLETAVKKLRAAGATVLNQSVLLRGVNDSVDALAALSLRLLDVGIVPYYLHQLDRVRGAQHFEVPETEGLRLLDELRTRVPGYGLPRYVREIAGEASKTPIVG